MMPTMQEIDAVEKRKEWPCSDGAFITLNTKLRDKLCAAARRGVEADDRLTHLEEAYQSAMRVGSEAQRRAEKLEAELAALKAAQPQEMPSTADDEATRWRHGEKI